MIGGRSGQRGSASRSRAIVVRHGVLILRPGTGQSDILSRHGERSYLFAIEIPAVEGVAIQLRSGSHSHFRTRQVDADGRQCACALRDGAIIRIFYGIRSNQNRGGFGQLSLIIAIGQTGVCFVIFACDVGGILVRTSRPRSIGIGRDVKADDQLLASPVARCILYDSVGRVVKASDADVLAFHRCDNASRIKGFIFGPYRRYAIAAGLINLNGDIGSHFGRGEVAGNSISQNRVAAGFYVGNHFIRNIAEDLGQSFFRISGLVIVAAGSAITHVIQTLCSRVIAGHRVHELIDVAGSIRGVCIGKNADRVDGRASVLQLLSLFDCIVCYAVIKTIAMVGLAVGEENNDFAASAVAQNGIGMLQTVVGRGRASRRNLVNFGL